MPLKKIDARISGLIERATTRRERAILVVIGKRGRDLLPHLHMLVQKKKKRSFMSDGVLWCFKRDLGFSSNRKKRVKEVQKLIKRGVIAADERDPFEAFISRTRISFVFYKDSARVMGQTFHMCVLQDFEAVTPNVLARTIETVEGGGLVVLLLHTVSALHQLYSLAMDAHARFRTDSRSQITPRFNERMILSLTTLRQCLFVDDSLDVLPISLASRTEVPLAGLTGDDNVEKLGRLRAELADVHPINALLAKSVTFDQAEALINLVDVILEKRSVVVSVTAGRGRGKSAALGLSVSAAIASGYGAIAVTAPHPDNLKTFFDFLKIGLGALGYEEHSDYTVRESGADEHSDSPIEIIVTRTHRQTVRYVNPRRELGDVELLVVDEAAAIPLTMVRKLLAGRHISFLSSTVNGYEGTGRSLTHKLISELRKKNSAALGKDSTIKPSLIECALTQPIRYRNEDEIENWLFDLLCLHSTPTKTPRGWHCPHPSQCALYIVNRNALFSHHKVSEAFLSSIVSLFVASHYKNSPNDLQLLSDSPSQLLFVLLGGGDGSDSSIPQILSAIQFSLEGGISSNSIASNMKRGYRPSGDLIPWTITQQFQDRSFGALKGGRVVRIATNPDYQRMGYGSKALELLHEFFAREVSTIDQEKMVPLMKADGEAISYEDSVAEERAGDEFYVPRKEIPPLLRRLDEVENERLDYLGVSFGSTQSLFSFWRRANYVPVYVRQTANELTGEHTIVMLREMGMRGAVEDYHTDFRRRFIALLSYEFSKFSPGHSLAILGPVNVEEGNEGVQSATDGDRLLNAYRQRLSGDDLNRVDAYARNQLDYHVILDTVPTLCEFFFTNKIPVRLSLLQQSILLSIGLRHISVTELEKELNLPSSQLLAILKRSLQKFSQFIKSLEEAEASAKSAEERESVNQKLNVDSNAVESTFVEEQEDDEAEERRVAGEERKRLEREFQEYVVSVDDKEWKEALDTGTDGVNQIISLRKDANDAGEVRGRKRKGFRGVQQKQEKKERKKKKEGGKKRRING